MTKKRLYIFTGAELLILMFIVLGGFSIIAFLLSVLDPLLSAEEFLLISGIGNGIVAGFGTLILWHLNRKKKAEERERERERE